MILVFLLYTLSGFIFTIGKITLFYGNPFFMIAMQMGIGGALTISFLYFVKKTEYRISFADVPFFLQVILFGIVIPFCLRSWGLQKISATKAAFIYTLMPLFTALFAYLFHKEKLTYQRAIGLMMGFFGMMPIFFMGTGQEGLYGTIGIASFADLAVLIAVASFGYNFIALSNLVKHRGCPAPIASGLTMLMGGIMTFGIAFLAEPVWIIKDPPIFYGLLALQIVVSNLICLNLEASLLKKYSPTLMAFAMLISLISTSFFGWILLNERIHISYLISFAIVVSGLLLFYHDEISSEKEIL